MSTSARWPPARSTELVDLGVDRHDLQLSKISGEKGKKAQVRVEAILSAAQAKQLAKQGVEMSAKKVDGKTAAEQANELAADGFEVFKKYAGAGGLKAEYEQAAADNPSIAKVVSIGKTVNGQDIIAMKVSKNARKDKDGKKPSVLYARRQHAREWITPEMNRRLMHHVLDNYGSDPKITRLVDKNELWFVPVANPDGYDFTFEPDQRLWRKNLRDNNNDGTIAPGDGVDLNRNFQTKWGYDNEGSSPNTGSETYRGPSAGLGAGDQGAELVRRAHRLRVPRQLPLRRRAAALRHRLAGLDADAGRRHLRGDGRRRRRTRPCPGYDPDISAELYTTNGDTDTHMTEAYGTLGFTPEMSTCEAASDSVPDDEWEAADCQSGFNFPDDEGLIQAEFEKNIPFALSVAESAGDPDDPASVVGRKAADFQVDSFDVSYGDPQTVAVVAKRALKDLRLQLPHQRRLGEDRQGLGVGGRRALRRRERRLLRRVPRPGPGGQGGRRGRGALHRRQARQGQGQPASRSRTPSRPTPATTCWCWPTRTTPASTRTTRRSVTAPKYAADYEQAINDAGYTTDVWDIDEQGVPHDLGVLGHYDAVVWYLGDNRLTQDPEDETITTPFGELPDIAVAEQEQYTTMAVRDYLNERRQAGPRRRDRAVLRSCPASATPSAVCSTG